MAFIRIDPTLPVVWRTPHAIQIGAESPLVIFDPLTQRDERMLAAARAGIPSEALAAVGGCADEDAAAFLNRIRPALVGAVPEPESTPVAALVRVHSAGREDIVRTARMLGLVGVAPGGSRRVGVIIADHAVPMRAYRDWMREGVPHFAIVFGTRSVTIGPVIVPGTTGCLRCADLHRRTVDPAWPAIAAQLVGLPAAAALDPIVRTEALCTATRRVRTLAQGITGIERLEPHPDCGCTLDLQVPLPRAG